MHALHKLIIGASKGTEEVKEALNHFLDYSTTNMQLNINSNAAYLVTKRACSRAGGYHYLGYLGETVFNDSIYILVKIIRAVIVSAAKSECGSLYINAQHAVPFITTLEELGCKQQAV